MREIKFRAWDKTLNSMLEVTKISDGIAYEGKYTNTGSHKLLSSPIIMQYTGLKDKNGVEIYEGDVLSFRDERGEVKYYPLITAFDALTDNGYISGSCFERSEVIGNIYENKELLNG